MSSVTARLDGVKVKMLQADSEAALKKLQDARRAHGKVLARTCQLAGLSKKEVSGLIGVSEPQLSGWFSGDPQAGHPQSWRFEQHPSLRIAYLKAQAEADHTVTVRTVIEIQERSA